MDPVTPSIAGIQALSAFATVSYYGEKSGLIASVARFFKGLVLQNVKAIVLDDYARAHVSQHLYSNHEHVKLVDIEKLFQISFNREVNSAIKQVRTLDADMFVAMASKSMKSLLRRFRYSLTRKTQVHILVSSVALAKKLGIKAKDIHVLVASDKLLDGAAEDVGDQKIHSSQAILSEKNEKAGGLEAKYFESFETLLKQVKAIVGEHCLDRRVTLIKKNSQ